MRIPEILKELENAMYRVSLFTAGKIDNIKYHNTSKLLTEILENFKSNKGLEHIDIIAAFCDNVMEFEQLSNDFKENDDRFKPYNDNAINTYIETYNGCLEIYNWITENFPEKHIKGKNDNDFSLLFKPNNELSLSIEKKTSTKREKKMVSYIWLGKPDIDLPELYDRMTNQYKLISPETTPEQFKAVFTGQPIDDKFEPIRWHQDNASELLYFIDRLEQAELIEHNEKKADYQKMTACFVKPDGKQFNANWKQIKQNIIINVASAKQKAIDELVKNFL